ncbi:DUF4381 domain-containing protein [Solemya velesiana gill symbiont]|uniref:DUF4381 domain-containing protein n=1 Tax=Solemya velesiana gill symbiont TaxID=1918948 RepID=A0A1T2KW14_9GAMM|nr:DUF4381 domain-containing protein [Solemya velesiana gill symbiont]OOZ37049.1 hypothetical protein BOW51_04375 [Solemya velesiana gill symbiont]
MMGGALHDIHGLDPVSWWPLAPGWWLVILSGAALVLLTWALVRYLVAYPPGSWRSEAHAALTHLKRRFRNGEIDIKQAATELSELLRRIAIARLGREHQASLTDEAWLRCLGETDQSGFDWERKGQLLITLPYAPENQQAGHEQMADLIRTTTNLIAPQKKSAKDKVEATDD